MPMLMGQAPSRVARMLSIIIPTFNEEKYITYLLDSIFAQSYRNYEIIIIDAQSTDGTMKVLRRIAGSLSQSSFAVPFSFHQVGFRNVSRQKNFGASFAKGSVLLFIDADMILPNPHFLYRMMKDMENSAIVAATCCLNSTNQKAKYRIADFFLNSFISALNKSGFAVARGGIQFVRRFAFDRIHGFNERSAVAEDIEFSRRVSRYGKIFYDGKVFALESDRRYRKEGYVRTILSWSINGIWCFLFQKSLYKRWKPVR